MVALPTNPTSAQANVVDPGLDTIMQMIPAGYQRSERDRLPRGPMTAATFNAVGVTTTPVQADNAVFYGASYERADGSLIVFLGMSSSHQADGQAFADAVIKGTLPDGRAFSAAIDGVKGVEGESNGVPAATLAFARNGRGFAITSRGPGTRDDSASFAKFVVGLAESTPTRSDAKPVEKLQPAAVALAAFTALAIVGIVASWRFVQRRAKRPRSRGPRPGRPDTLEHPVAVHSPPRPSPRPNPR